TGDQDKGGLEVRKKMPLLIIFALLPLMITIFLFNSCTEKYPGSVDANKMTTKNGCVSCHLNADKLKQLATPLPPPDGEAGEG
ncbi:hypothetical protein JXQ31_20130, partial [candidate division KSB1 bacterium]|nr:hypothetical protein [candidate division KSB1 bacterium]